MGKQFWIAVAMMAVASACASTTPAGDTEVLVSEMSRAAARPDAAVPELVSGFNQAGFDLFLTRDQTVNTVLSPLSIGHAVLMAEAAADADTATSIRTSFGLPDDPHEAWNALDSLIVASNRTATNVAQKPTPIVTVAGRAWPAAGRSPSQQWLDVLAAQHGAGTETIDVNQPEQSADQINGWVSEETNGLIDRLITPSFITPDTVLVLTDAVYFEAQWARVFGKYGTVTQQFTALDGTTVFAQFNLDLEQPGRRGTGNGFVAAEVDYAGGDYSMLLVVPDEGNFSAVRAGLSNDFVAEVDEVLADGPWELRLPEWTTDTSFDFLAWLEAAGAAPGVVSGNLTRSVPERRGSWCQHRRGRHRHRGGRCYCIGLCRVRSARA